MTPNVSQSKNENATPQDMNYDASRWIVRNTPVESEEPCMSVLQSCNRMSQSTHQTTRCQKRILLIHASSFGGGVISTDG